MRKTIFVAKDPTTMSGRRDVVIFLGDLPAKVNLLLPEELVQLPSCPEEIDTFYFLLKRVVCVLNLKKKYKKLGPK